MIENGSRSEGIPGVFQATRVVFCAKAALPGVMGSALFGYKYSQLQKSRNFLYIYYFFLFKWELDLVYNEKKYFIQNDKNEGLKKNEKTNFDFIAMCFAF